MTKALASGNPPCRAAGALQLGRDGIYERIKLRIAASLAQEVVLSTTPLMT